MESHYDTNKNVIKELFFESTENTEDRAWWGSLGLLSAVHS